MPMLPCTISAILLMSASVAAFTYYLSPTSAYSQTESFSSSSSSSSLYKNIVSSSSSEQQIQQQSQSKVIEASGHFANNQIENDSVSWIQGSLWHIAVFNSSAIAYSSTFSVELIILTIFTVS